MTAFYNQDLASRDADVFATITEELERQQNGIELIASENIVSRAVLQAQGSIMTNKYAEGYPGKRYYGGCYAVDKAEVLAIERVCKLFGCSYANVQPHSGSQANQGVFFALLQPGDTILGMSLAAGGHLTHGAAPNQSGKWFHAVQYGLDPQTQDINYDEVERLALECQPKLIIAGGSAIPRTIDFARFRAIADKVGAYLMVDMAHFAGLVAGGAHPSPFPHAHVVTSTTHKTLRGPRGGLILADAPDMGKKLNSSIFPGLQGGPLMHVIAAKAVAFGEALQPDFKTYAQNVVANCKVMGDALMARGYKLVSGGTDTHLILVDLQAQKITGADAEKALERAHLTCNKNAVPNDPLPPTKTSGIRLGSPAATSRGFGAAEFTQIGTWIADVLDALAKGDATATETRIKAEVEALCKRFPIYPNP
ncbi:MAG: serine hydroxymethyltransferase [Bdellovibrionales bacterium]